MLAKRVCTYAGETPACSNGRSEASVPGSFQHSPSFRAQSKSCGEMLHLGRGESLGKGVCDHVVGWAINKAHGSALDDPSNEMVSYIDVLRARMVLVVACEGDGGLVV